jgi:NADH dehydrogenase
MPGKVFLTGGSGFVGQAVVEELVGRGWSINALTNHRKLEAPGDIHNYKGSLFDDDVLDDAMIGCEAVIHLVGIIMEKPSKGITFERIHHEGTRHIVDAAKRNGIRRYVHMSAMGVRDDAVSEYHRSKFRAEQYVRASGLDWTIIRPSLIHGPKGEFMQMEARWARKQAAPFLFMPYFGGGMFGQKGAGKLQPVYVRDVARGFADALDKPQTIGEVYLLGGPHELTWFELHRASALGIVGHKRWVMPLPAWYAKLLTHLVPPALLPFNRDQVLMSQENNTGDTSKFIGDFGFEPVAFEPTLQAYAKQM